MTDNTQNETKTSQYLGLLEKKHCGRGYFIPSFEWVQASSKEEAIRLLRAIPRVAHDNDHAVIFCKKRTYLECWMARLINDFDEYLTSKAKKGRDTDIQDRIVVSPLYLKYLEKRAFEERDPRAIEEYNSIKTADKYDKTQVLQRYCAPIWSKERLIFPPMDVDNLLREHFEVMTEQIAMQPIAQPLRQNYQSEEAFISAKSKYEKLSISRIKILMIYYKLFGFDNPLGIRYNRAEHELTYIINKRETFKIPEGVRYSQIQTFFEMAFGVKNPLNMTFNPSSKKISCDTEKVVLTLKENFDISQLCKSLQLTPNFTKELCKLEKFNAVKHIYQYLFLSENKSGKPFDPLKSKFDFETNSVCLNPKYIIHTKIPNVPFDVFAQRSENGSFTSAEDFIMGGNGRAVFAQQKTETNEPIIADNDKSWPSQLDKFNAKLAKTAALNKGK